MSESLPVTTTPNPIGRPTKYRKKYCKDVIRLGETGQASAALIAADLGFAASTIQLWEKTHADFSVAINRARALAERYWYNRYTEVAATRGKEMAQAFAIFHMKNSFGWEDHRSVKHSGQVNHNHTAAGQAFAAHVKELEQGKSKGNADAIDAEYTVLDQ